MYPLFGIINIEITLRGDVKVIKHIILWNFQEGKGSEEDKLKIKNELEGLKDKIPGIIKIEVVTTPIAGSNADIMLNSTFESIEDLNNYQVHEEHFKVAEFVRSITCNRMCMDFFSVDD